MGEIIKRFEQRGYQLMALKAKIASEELLNTHYADLVKKPFFPSLRDYMCSGPVICMVWCACCRSDREQRLEHIPYQHPSWLISIPTVLPLA